MRSLRSFLANFFGGKPQLSKEQADPFRGVSFPDGTIFRYTIANDTLFLYFEDYGDVPINMHFTGGIEVIEQGCVRNQIIKYRLETIGDRRKVTFVDSDDIDALSVTFEDCEITFGRSRDKANNDLPDTSGSWPPAIASPEVITAKKPSGTSFLLSWLLCFVIPVPYSWLCGILIALVGIFIPALLTEGTFGLTMKGAVLGTPIVACCLIARRNPNASEVIYGLIAGMILGSLLFFAT